MEDGSVRYNGSWKYSPEGQCCQGLRTSEGTREDVKHPKTKGARLSGVRTWDQCQNWSEKHICLSVNNSSLFRKRQLVDGEIRRRWTGVETSWAWDNDDNRDSKRVRLNHKQPDKRADLELTDDALAKPAKLCDTPSSSPSSHELAPKLHVSFGGAEDSETRESVMTKPCVDIDMEISVIETLTNAKLEVDRTTQRTRRCVVCWKKFHLSLRLSPMPQYATVYMYESEADAKTIGGNWVLKPHKARYVLRGFEEDVEDEDVFASTTRQHQCGCYSLKQQTSETKFTQCTAFLNAHMKDGDVVYARPPPEWQPENRIPTKEQ